MSGISGKHIITGKDTKDPYGDPSPGPPLLEATNVSP
jgi:hypothetical protein